MRITTCRYLGCLFVVVAMVGGGCEQSEDAPSDHVEAVIGPEGGELRGEDGTPLQGVVLQVPPGALAEPTRFELRAVEDRAPLPDGAERVGPQFRIEPPVTFASAARLILPVDERLRDGLGAKPSDVKVWVRTEEPWTLVEPAATNPVRVAIDIERGGLTAAAGVVLPSFVEQICALIPAPACGQLQPPQPEQPVTCLINGDYCIEQLPSPARIDSPFTLGNGFLAYKTNVGDRRDAQIVRIRLSDRSVDRSVVSDFLSDFRSDDLVDADGNVWRRNSLVTFGSAASVSDFSIPGGIFTYTRAVLRGRLGPQLILIGHAAGMDSIVTVNPQRRLGNGPVRFTVSDPIPFPRIGRAVDARVDPSGTSMWVAVADEDPASNGGVSTGRLVNMDGAGEVRRVLNVADDTLFLVTFSGSGGGAFGNSDIGGTASARIASISGTRILVEALGDLQANRVYLTADLSDPDAVLERVELPDLSTGFPLDKVREAVMDSAGRIYFIFGAFTRRDLFAFDPSSGELVSIPIPDAQEVDQLEIDGDHPIARGHGAPDADPLTRLRLWRIRRFGD